MEFIKYFVLNVKVYFPAKTENRKTVSVQSNYSSFPKWRMPNCQNAKAVCDG